MTPGKGNHAQANNPKMKLNIYFAEYRPAPCFATGNTISNAVDFRYAYPAGSRYPSAVNPSVHGPAVDSVQTLVLVPEDQRLDSYRDAAATIISLDSVRAYDPARKQWVALNIAHGGAPISTIDLDLPLDPAQWVPADKLTGVSRLIAFGSASGHLTTIDDEQLRSLFGR